jgi:hypothetical protein
MKILSRSIHCPGGIDSNPVLPKYKTEVLSLEATFSVKETTRESELQRCSIDGGLVERLHFASLQGNIYHNYMKSTSYEVYYISRGAGHLRKLLLFKNFGQRTCIVLYWLPYLHGKGNNSFYTVFEVTNCKINNNHLSRFFYMFRPLQGHHKESIYNGI